jgi:hypothetical protein
MLKRAFVGLITLSVMATAAVAQEAAPMRIPVQGRLFVPSTEFGMALSAAILRKHVPVSAVNDSTKASFFLQSSSVSSKESGGERVAKIFAFGAFAGSGKHFDASVTITNRDGSVVFAHNSKKGNFQSAAENIANEIKKHIENQ